ncbi:hypothetical protein D3C81_2069630 [compost metagenome]
MIRGRAAIVPGPCGFSLVWLLASLLAAIAFTWRAWQPGRPLEGEPLESGLAVVCGPLGLRAITALLLAPGDHLGLLVNQLRPRAEADGARL